MEVRSHVRFVLIVWRRWASLPRPTCAVGPSGRLCFVLSFPRPPAVGPQAMPGWCIQQGEKVSRKVSLRFFAFVAGDLLVGDPQNQLGIQTATRHINFARRTLGRSLRIRSHARCSNTLTMFGHAHANSSKRGSFGFSWALAATMQKPAFIASPLRRQHDPEVEAAICTAREVHLTGVQ